MARTPPSLVGRNRQNLTLGTTASTYSLTQPNDLAGSPLTMATDDMVILSMTFVNTNPAVSNLSGWTQLTLDTVNTRKFGIWYRRRLSGDGSSYSTPTFTSTGGGGNADAQQTVWRGVDWSATIVTGTVYKRGSSITTMDAASITVGDGSTAITFGWEASNNTETADTETATSGWTRAQGFGTQTTSSTLIEHVTSWYQKFTTGTTTGTMTITWPQAGSNGAAQQIAIQGPTANVPPSAGFTHVESGLLTTITSTATDSDGTISTYDYDWGDSTTHGSTANPTHTYASSGTYTVVQLVTDNGGATDSVSHSVTVTSSPPATGQIGIRTCSNFGQDYLTIGMDKLGGSVLEVVLYDATGTTEITRHTMTNDATTGWGNVSFTGLTANTTYAIKAVVDSTVQTDVAMLLKTLKAAGTASSYLFVAGSCNFTNSNHPIWDNITALNPEFIDHMGDDGYMDATTESAWRAGVESTMTTSKRIPLHSANLFHHNYDNHDRIITNPTGAGTGLNNGETDAATNTEWRYLAGTSNFSSTDTLGRSWQVGRVLYIATDHWSVRDDADGDPAPRTMMGATQKAWFKALLTAAATDSSIACIVWFSQWTAQNDANGRWNSYDEETTELENHINALANNGKTKLIMLGGDSHILQADSGARTFAQGSRFSGVPSLNMSGFNRSSYPYSTGNWNIAESELRGSGSTESDWGGYSKVTITDSGGPLKFHWDAVRVNASGTEDVMASFEKIFANTATLAGTGALTANGASSFTGTVSLSGTGVLTGSAVPSPKGSATLSGAGSLTATASPSVAATASFSGNGALITSGIVGAKGVLTLTGTGTLAGTGAANGSASGTASFAGAGALNALGAPRFAGTATLGGSGALTFGTVVGVKGTLTLAGTGALTGVGGAAYTGVATLAGTGALTASGIASPKGAIALAGTGNLAATGTPRAAGSLVLTGVGNLTADGKGNLTGTIVFTGTGVLDASGHNSSGDRNITVTATISARQKGGSLHVRWTGTIDA